MAEGDQLRWVRRAKPEDSIIIGSRLGMAIHFKTDNDQLRPLGRATRGVRAMKLRANDELISMDILSSQVIANLAPATESESEEETTEDTNGAEVVETNGAEVVETPGPWVLVVTMGGYGKRVPVSQFRLQNRAGMGILATKFRLPKDNLAALRVVNQGEELMIVTKT